jgi:putative DNA primase/helicase
LPAIPEHPTRNEAMEALQLLTGLLAEFRFESDLDRAVALSGLLTAVVRGSMPIAPMHLFRAHVAGTGKSYLVDTCSVIATGQRCPVIVAPKSEEELEKRLGAMVMSGVPIISLDNVEHDLGGPALCQLTERPRVRLRILGLSEAPEFDCKAAVFATGNNVAVRGDMTRRALICTMDAMEERPELRAFKHRPVDIVLADRGKYIAAALTMIRGYVRAHGVQVRCAPIGSYDEWSKMVREPLVWLGESDPVVSMETARAEDPQLADIREFFESELLALDTSYKTQEIIDLAAGNDEAKAFLARVSDSNGGVPNARELGKWLRKISGRPVGGLRLSSVGSDRSRPKWRLCNVVASKAAT